jgi:hypothetical protein
VHPHLEQLWLAEKSLLSEVRKKNTAEERRESLTTSAIHSNSEAAHEKRTKTPSCHGMT